MTLIYLTVFSFIAWCIGLVSGGGSPLIQIPLVSFLLGAESLAPIITTGQLIGNSQRIFLFWQDINWSVTAWYLPGAISGAILGAFAFTKIQAEWLQLVLGLFLILTVLSYGFGEKERSFTVNAWHFLPAGFVHAFLSGLIGSTGPLMNPFFLNYGLIKEQMIATKAITVVLIHVVKMITYAGLGALTTQSLGYGIAIGLSAIPANWVGQYFLKKINEKQFRQLVLATMAVSGALMIWNEIGLYFGG